MCGRYTLHTHAGKLAQTLALSLPDNYAPDYNIGPGREILVIAPDEGGRKTCRMHWGLKTPQNFHVNARIETADTAPRFRDSWESYRCLVPANGFYEWYADGVTKQPYYIYPESGELTYFAGLWYPPAQEDAIATCLLLTTDAVPSIRQIHPRMPVLLDASLHEAWLGNSLRKAEAVEATQQLALTGHPISRRINSVQHNDSRLIEACSPLNDDQLMLF